jgi:radical SAM protein (TIGR04043 family)/putative N-acetyltransferase (TIGR04045 family)
LRNTITEIQSLGINVPSDMLGRKGGAGPAEGRAFLINNLPVNVPIAAHYVLGSPFTLKPFGKGYHIAKHDREILCAKVVPEPRFYSRQTKDGIPYRKIALLHGDSCLATTVLQNCVHWKQGRKCTFCSSETSIKTGHTIARKTPEQLAEVALAARDLDGITHMVLTSGTGDPPGSEIVYLAACARAVIKKAAIPVQVQFAPPPDLGLIQELSDAGVSSVGIHVESFDTQILKQVAPAKAAIGLAHYERAWKTAVELFGPNQVSSFLIAGLGESPESIVWGSEYLADLGVYPFVVPLRPIPGSTLEGAIPPDAATMKRIYEAVAVILAKKELSLNATIAGCVKCGACSALPFYEKCHDGIVCHSARNQRERSEAFAIRNEVFVREQKMFDTSDIDDNDLKGTQLVARSKGLVVGTVRIYPENHEKNHWVGGRLAVRKDYRNTRAGSDLVKEAMKRVKKKGCRVFMATIQEQNVSFFKKLGWAPQGPLEMHSGHPHQPMQADLGRVPGDM